LAEFCAALDVEVCMRKCDPDIRQSFVLLQSGELVWPVLARILQA
jgi:hypothetical protein